YGYGSRFDCLGLRPVGGPGAVSVWTELQPDLPAFFDGIVAVTIDDDRALSVDLDLVLDALADEERGVRRAADHARRYLGRRGGEDLHVLGTDADVDRLADLDSLSAIGPAEH